MSKDNFLRGENDGGKDYADIDYAIRSPEKLEKWITQNDTHEVSHEEKKKKQEAGKSKPPKEVFKPTEEISEDLPVPFPVDI